MNTRRQAIHTLIATLAGVVNSSSAGPDESGIKTVAQIDLPPLHLEGSQLTTVILTIPPGAVSKPHTHPGFVVGYVLEGPLRFQIEGEREQILAAGAVFYEPPGAVHVRAESASAAKSARVLALVFGEKGKPLSIAR